MFDLSTVQRQHTEILALAHELLAYDSSRKVIEDAYNLSLLLAKLSGKLRMHLSGEDQSIYPFLMSKEDPSIQATSKRFATEMGGLAQVFNDYKTKYLSAAKIENSPADFIEETHCILQAVAVRIDREEKLLYLLL